MSPHSLSYKFVPLERRPLCRRVQALQEHRKKCRNVMAKSLVGMTTAVFEVKVSKEVKTGWEIVRHD